MLSIPKVQHIVDRIYEEPSAKIQEEARQWSEEFETSRSVGTFCAGMSAMALFTNLPYYNQLAKALFDIGIDRGIPIEDLLPWHLREDVQSDLSSIEDASTLVAEYKEGGLVTGFIHGHYRLFTPSNFATILVASERCDLLVLGLEDGWRASTYKSTQGVARDWQRWQWVHSAGFEGCVVRIRRYAYTDQGYENLLRGISPNIYWGHQSDPNALQNAMEKRARNCGLDFKILTTFEGHHTSELLGEGL